MTATRYSQLARTLGNVYAAFWMEAPTWNSPRKRRMRDLIMLIEHRLSDAACYGMALDTASRDTYRRPSETLRPS